MQFKNFLKYCVAIHLLCQGGEGPAAWGANLFHALKNDTKLFRNSQILIFVIGLPVLNEILRINCLISFKNTSMILAPSVPPTPFFTWGKNSKKHPWAPLMPPLAPFWLRHWWRNQKGANGGTN